MRGEEARGDEQAAVAQAPEIPEDIVAGDLDKDVRAELLTLSREVADKVARHLVAAGQVIDEDSELALRHAVAARRLASRIAVVREAVGLAAYAAGDWTTAIAELRTYHRMTGKQTHLAEIADSERALGRPERAIDLFRGADLETLDKAGAIELLVVAAGARGDLGQHDAAVAMLQVPELTGDEDAEWAARLRYAFADALLAADRRDEAREWFSRAAALDEDQLTDAAERLLELDGITIEDDDVEDEDEDDDLGDEEGAGAQDAAAGDETDDLGDDEDDEDDEDEEDADDVDDEFEDGRDEDGDDDEEDDVDDLDDEFDEDDDEDEDEDDAGALDADPATADGAAAVVAPDAPAAVAVAGEADDDEAGDVKAEGDEFVAEGGKRNGE